MALIVMKFGGTSVQNVDRIRKVASRVAEVRKSGNDVVVVVSAMAGETDRLLKLAQDVASRPSEREIDMMISSGERVTSALLALALQGVGLEAQAFTGRQVGIITTNIHTKARIERVDADRVQKALADKIIPVIAGFQGINERSDVTTLGRGGSDLTAVALAAALKADHCDIYTDVDGVYTADPGVVPGARRIRKISYDEMLEMASLGAKVLQARAVEFAANHKVPIRVVSSFKEGEGTLVTEEDGSMEQVVVSGVTYDKNQAKITITGVPDRPGIAGRLFEPIAEANILVDMIIQNVSHDGLTDISFTVPRPDATKSFEFARKIAGEIGARDAHLKEDIANISVIGVGMRSHSGVAAKMFSVLSQEGINIMMISTSEIKISCVIDAKYTELGVRSLHEAFKLGEG
ncbi:MAG TPA: aspartate kinase [Nitrospiria bacterium]